MYGQNRPVGGMTTMDSPRRCTSGYDTLSACPSRADPRHAELRLPGTQQRVEDHRPIRTSSTGCRARHRVGDIDASDHAHAEAVPRDTGRREARREVRELPRLRRACSCGRAASHGGTDTGRPDGSDRRAVTRTSRRRRRLRTSSSQSVADQIAAGIAANNAGIAAQNTQLGNQAQRAQGFALALAQATKPNPDQIQGYYQEAADRLRGYGTGLTGAVAADQQAETDATRAAVDAGNRRARTGHELRSRRAPQRRADGGRRDPRLLARSSGCERRDAGSVRGRGVVVQHRQHRAGVPREAERSSRAERRRQRRAPGAAPAAVPPGACLRDDTTATGHGDRALGARADEHAAQHDESDQHAHQARKPAFDATKSKALGYRVDQYGNPILGPNGGRSRCPTGRSPPTARARSRSRERRAAARPTCRQKTTKGGTV